MPPRKYLDFVEREPVKRIAKVNYQSADRTRNYVGITCPHCNDIFVEIPEEHLSTNKASECKRHLSKCSKASEKGVVVNEVKRRSPFGDCGERPSKRLDAEAGYQPSASMAEMMNEAAFGSNSSPAFDALSDKRKLPREDSDDGHDDNEGKCKVSPGDGDIVTIYALVYIPTGQRVYIGRTKDPERRLSQHASRSSKCRLVRDAFRNYGRKSFNLEPIVRCRASDADANESFYIIQNKTLYPGGYNLRHGSMAGKDNDTDNTSVVAAACTCVIPFAGFVDESLACSEGWADVADIAADLDMPEGTED